MPKKPKPPAEPSGFPNVYQVKDASTAAKLAKDLRIIGYQAQADGDTVGTDAGPLTVAAQVSSFRVLQIM